MFEGMCNIEIQNTKILDIKINATIFSTCLLDQVQYTSNGQVAPKKSSGMLLKNLSFLSLIKIIYIDWLKEFAWNIDCIIVIFHKDDLLVHL